MDLPSFDLLADVFTFLALLHSDDIAPRQKRFLSPMTINRLNSLFVVQEEIRFAPRYRKGGKRGLTERETDRIRFVHFLSEAAHLVARTGRFLKPTPRGARWLTRSTLERTRALFDAVFLERNRRIEDLWRTYRLPGFRLASPYLVIAPLLETFRAIPFRDRVKLTTLCKMIPLETYDDSPENQPTTIIRATLHYLEWLGVIQADAASSFRLTDLGAHLLGVSSAPTLPHDPAPQPLVIKSDLMIRVPRHPDLSTLYELADYASPSPAQRGRVEVRVFDHDRVQRTLTHGATFASIIHFLEDATQDALPRAVVETLQTWAQEIERVTIRRLTLLETRDRVTMEQLTRVRGIRACIRRTLLPRVVTVRVDHLPVLIRQLKRNGYPPRVELPQPSTYPTNKPLFHRVNRRVCPHPCVVLCPVPQKYA